MGKTDKSKGDEINLSRKDGAILDRVWESVRRKQARSEKGAEVMALTVQQINQLISDAVLGAEKPSIDGPEAEAMFHKLKAEAKKVKDEGGMLAMVEE